MSQHQLLLLFHLSRFAFIFASRVASSAGESETRPHAITVWQRDEPNVLVAAVIPFSFLSSGFMSDIVANNP